MAGCCNDQRSETRPLLITSPEARNLLNIYYAIQRYYYFIRHLFCILSSHPIAQNLLIQMSGRLAVEKKEDI